MNKSKEFYDFYTSSGNIAPTPPWKKQYSDPDFVDFTNYYKYEETRTEQRIQMLEREMNELKNINRVLLNIIENPELMEKYQNLRKAFEEYKFLRDLVLKPDEMKKTRI